jgi:chromosome segregation ATPase
MLQAVAYDTSDESSSPARVVRLKSLEEIARAKSPEESQLQAALNAVAQASHLMEQMQRRCAEIENQAEEYVYQCRGDVTKAREQVVQLEQRLRHAEDLAKNFQVQAKTQTLHLRELEVSNRELIQRAEAAEAALKDRTDAVALLQTAINDHLDAGLKRINSIGESRLNFMSVSTAAA